MLCFCTKISQLFKLSSSSRVEEEVAILSFISVANNWGNQGGPKAEGREKKKSFSRKVGEQNGDGRVKTRGEKTCEKRGVKDTSPFVFVSMSSLCRLMYEHDLLQNMQTDADLFKWNRLTLQTDTA